MRVRWLKRKALDRYTLTQLATFVGRQKPASETGDDVAQFTGIVSSTKEPVRLPRQHQGMHLSGNWSLRTFRTLVSTGNLNRAEMFKREGATYNHAGRRLVGNGGLGGAGVVLRGIDV
jgi:hypothetical protein